MPYSTCFETGVVNIIHTNLMSAPNPCNISWNLYVQHFYIPQFTIFNFGIHMNTIQKQDE